MLGENGLLCSSRTTARRANRVVHKTEVNKHQANRAGEQLNGTSNSRAWARSVRPATDRVHAGRKDSR